MAEADQVGPVPCRLTDRSEIRRLLNTDREWWALPNALALVFRGIAIRPVFVLGDARSTKRLLEALPETTGYLNLKTHQVGAAEGIYRYRERHEMRRMFLDAFQPHSGITEP